MNGNKFQSPKDLSKVLNQSQAHNVLAPTFNY